MVTITNIKLIGIKMKANEELNRIGIYKCPECKCPTGEDWKYKDFTNKRIIICPQCKETIFIEAD